MNDVTALLDAVARGDRAAADRLLPLVYDELRNLAARRMAQEQPGHTLQATALVHEAYLRLVGVPGGAASACRDPHWDGRGHFFAAAAEAMRRILVESARRKRRQKRGGRMERLDVEPDSLTAPDGDDRVVALNEALTRFAALEPAKAELVKLRAFAGLTADAAAAALGVSPATADRWWAYARAWLRVEISGEKTGDR